MVAIVNGSYGSKFLFCDPCVSPLTMTKTLLGQALIVSQLILFSSPVPLRLRVNLSTPTLDSVLFCVQKLERVECSRHWGLILLFLPFSHCKPIVAESTSTRRCPRGNYQPLLHSLSHLTLFFFDPFFALLLQGNSPNIKSSKSQFIIQHTHTHTH